MSPNDAPDERAPNRARTTAARSRPSTPPPMTPLEYVILLVLVTAVGVGLWKTFGEGTAVEPTPAEAASSGGGDARQHVAQHRITSMHA